MARKILLAAFVAVSLTLVTSAEALAWGFAHYSYHYGAGGARFHYGYHYGGGGYRYGGYHYGGYHYGGYGGGGARYGYYRRY